MVHSRTTTLQRLSATAGIRIDATFHDRPCVVFFEQDTATISIVDVEADRVMITLPQMPHNPPIRLEGTEIVWDQRRLGVEDDAQHLSDAELFVSTVNGRVAPEAQKASTARFSPPDRRATPLRDQTYEGPYFQFAVINIGSFRAVGRLQRALGIAASEGWDLVAIYDKASNWMQGMEKGFILLKRPVPDGRTMRADEWCITLNLAGT